MIPLGGLGVDSSLLELLSESLLLELEFEEEFELLESGFAKITEGSRLSFFALTIS